MSEQLRVTTEAQAIATAMRLTGFDKLPGITATTQRVTVAEDNTPFLSKQIVNRLAWRVEVGSVSLKLKSAVADFRDPYLRNFVILIDENAGQLLSVTSKYEGEASDLRLPPSADAAEKQLRAQQEIYHGFPPSAPRIAFLDALDSVLSRGIGSPFLAKEIHASYILHSERGARPRPVWTITLRGLPPRPAHGPGGDEVPVWQRNQMRNVVDATSGVVLFATNTPHPE